MLDAGGKQTGTQHSTEAISSPDPAVQRRAGEEMGGRRCCSSTEGPPAPGRG